MGQTRMKSLEELMGLIETLRGEGGCPWDRRQTPETMAVYLLEETHELIEAIAAGDAAHVCEELGDVLFQLLFIASLFAEKGAFDLAEAAGGIRDKMIRRHPHVFGEKEVSGEGEVITQWEEIKRDEKAGRADASVLDRIPTGLPALARAYRVSERVAAEGFDWDDMAGVADKVEEEWREFREALAAGDARQIEMEFGDLLFTLTNVARFAKIHPEISLAAATGKFERRYRLMESALAEGGRPLKSVPRDEVDRLWEQAKAAADGYDAQ